MSQIKTTEIDGDVAVGRHVTAGGNATIQGNTTVKKNLKVEGWLDARNIKGPNKGIFLDVTKLREAYPLPHDGWWALVGNTLPAPLYIADGGAWVATGESAGNPTIDSQQYNEAVAELDADLKALATEVSTNKQSIEQIRTQINTIGTSVNTLTSDVSGLKTRVTNAENRITTTESGIKAITNSKGMSNGIAPLDGSGRIPARYIPGAMDDVKEFDGFTDETANPISITGDVSVKFNAIVGCFIACHARTIDADYANNWDNADSYGTFSLDGRIPDSDKVYVDKMTNKTYRWSGSQMVVIGSDLALGHTDSTAFPGNEGAQLQENLKNTNNQLYDTSSRLRGLGILPCDGQWDGTGSEPKSGVWLCPNGEGGVYFRSFGSTNFYGIAEEEYNSDINYNPDSLYRVTDGLYRIVNDKLTMVGGASVGNTFNLTAEIPTPDPDKIFYNLNDKTDKYYAPAIVFAQDKANYGLQITFAVAHGSWKIYQYIGATLDEDDVLNADNWLDLAGMSAGAEAIVNVNEVCEDKDYTMSLAIQALIDLRDNTGVNYLKTGLIITYRRDSTKIPHVWETKQFVGQVQDIAATNGDELWPDFGGGGGLSFDLSDEPEVNGTKALSTGGAYEMEQRSFGGLEITPDPTNYIIQAVSKKGDPLGDSVKIPKSNGTGGQSGSVLTIYCDSAVWGAYGSRHQECQL